MEKIIEKFQGIDWIVIGGKLISAILVLIIGFWVVKVITKGIGKALNIKKFDNTLKGFLLNLVSSICKIVVVLGALSTAGIDMTVIGTIIAASTLAIGMSLQGSLSNIAGGVLIMVLKPFRVGDFIIAQGQEGFVKRIELFTTKLTTTDNKEVILPNGVLSNGNVVNCSSEPTRRVDITFGVSYDADLKETRKVLLDTINKYPKVLKNPAPVALVTELADSSVNFATRTWVNSSDYWDAYFFIMEEVKIALDEAGIEIPYPHSVEIQKQG
ncbi:MAG: mechanosensitive ion channel [Tenacibaculum sp.]|nr:mechanosensitive ion channel [Tenacibaculum sp.]